MSLKRQYDAARAAPKKPAPAKGSNGGAANGPYSDFNYNYQAHESRTYTYRAGQNKANDGDANGTGGSKSYQRQGQQSYEEWRRTKEEEADEEHYNYFYRDARKDGTGSSNAHHDHFRSGSSTGEGGA
mmetsp:Transcript_43517/g.57582  ORF Transcript_43517/g.57582 Transcript_43517/m.57582 type:complete len:128 (+) Transcript_43517:366-749(+)|eukprot:CAMPEP_0185590582 /NCGR_PEP_ID=MMETSP0434-20130131/61270_1 /TAXON_ID=626734 ORGANISM="Favella taraikaensis, Strain Fe Narragansett Bay" /NCGR_SAMPLE_ID=MMETSP0434 /ASSEMBLY_ACC=CAM_ASM_000379 /LENGTH=127 /DNA_ID=CAMNT_0028214877 /DNA_START=286 /DNA_END=669 /DNA_ORIENTATION=-